MNNERNEARVVPKKRKSKSPIPIKMHYIIGTRNERKTKSFSKLNATKMSTFSMDEF